MRPREEWQGWTVAITGMNAKPDNPGPGFAVARCLYESSHFTGRLVGLGYDVLDPGLYANSVLNSGYLMPYPSTGEEAVLERVLQVHKEEGLDVIIPCLDAEIQTFINLESTLARHGIRVLVPGAASLRRRDKDRLSALCEEVELRHPETRRVCSPEFFEHCSDEGWEYPLVVKGPFYDAVVCYDSWQAKRAFHNLAQRWGYPILVQEYVCGQELNLTGLADRDGRLLGTVMMAKRALTDKGKAWAGVTIADNELEEMAQRLVRALNWRGPLEVEALRAEDGTLYLIEINPRFPAWIYLSYGVKRNLPVQLLRLLAGHTSFLFPPLPAGHMFIRFAQELTVSLDVFEHLMMAGQRNEYRSTTLKEAL